MSSNTEMDVRRREVSALADGVTALEFDLAAKGINAVDEDDRFEVMDILNRIERRMLQNMPAQEAAE